MSDDLIRRSDAIKDLCDITNNSDMPKDWHRGMSVAISALYRVAPADRPQGYWTKTDIATYRCSECGKIQIADDVNELNFCCCCGSRNKVRRKGAEE